MPVTITVNADSAVAKYDAILHALTDFLPALEDIHTEILVPSAAEVFAAEGRPDPWPDLTDEYAERKQKAVGDLPILVYSGELRDSVATVAGNASTILEIGEQELTFGTTRPWAETHQEGISPQPERRFLQHEPENIPKYEAILVDYLLGRNRYAVR